MTQRTAPGKNWHLERGFELLRTFDCEPAPVNRLVISSADSNTGSFGIPKTVAFRLVLQLGCPG
ncbi:hypothetical protein TNCV_379721 [Trichonephila clavipes]|nr:hypothetical protein TNCV_379721 [Trichonephila clavipes]